LDTHPDFEAEGRGPEPGIVASRLNADGKPVYAGAASGTNTTAGREYFDQWYRDVPSVNQSTTIDLQLQASPRMEDFYVYEDHSFFPIDGELLGNQGRLHNFHFTLEGVATFYYREGQVFRFIGDDDVWVFINDHLVIDLGGTHQELKAEVELDEVAKEIGIEPNNEYSLHIFFAERHTLDSNFTIETSIANLGQCPEG
jgi:fibro-slime domain-containing protein